MAWADRICHDDDFETLIAWALNLHQVHEHTEIFDYWQLLRSSFLGHDPPALESTRPSGAPLTSSRIFRAHNLLDWGLIREPVSIVLAESWFVEGVRFIRARPRLEDIHKETRQCPINRW
jgi:hypothetical protein